MMPSMLARSRTALLTLVTAALVVLGPTTQAEAKRWEDIKLNVALTIPDEPYPWTWIPYSSSFKKYDIVKGAQRIVEKLRSGQPADGEGASLHLVVRDAPKDATLDSVAADAKIRKFLLGRFVSHEEVSVDETELIGEVPARVIATEGKSKNFKEKECPCRGVMVVALLRGKLYLMRMYAWHTEYDQEGLTADLDFMEGEGLSFLITREEPKGPEKPPTNGGGPAEEEVERFGEDEILWFDDEKLKVVKDGRLESHKIDARSRKQFMIMKLEGNHEVGSYQIFLYAIPQSRVVNGQSVPPEDLRKGITTTWYGRFMTAHPAGDIYRYKWPKKGKYITLPELTDENRIVQFNDKKKRVNSPSMSDVFKMGIVQKVKKSRVGETKASEAMRGNLQGLLSGVGRVTTFRWAWKSKDYAFKMIVTIARDGYERFGDPVRKTLESFEIFKKRPKNIDKLLEEQAVRKADWGAKHGKKDEDAKKDEPKDGEGK